MDDLNLISINFNQYILSHQKNQIQLYFLCCCKNLKKGNFQQTRSKISFKALMAITTRKVMLQNLSNEQLLI